MNEVWYRNPSSRLQSYAMDIGPHVTHAAAAAAAALAAAPPAPDDVRIVENNNIQVNNHVINDVNVFLHELQAEDEDELQELDDAIDEPINL